MKTKEKHATISLYGTAHNEKEDDFTANSSNNEAHDSLLLAHNLQIASA